ncbi:related to Damage response protein 1 [Hanseniaspora guilliermondii]|uniref:Related to Damage response protein 1 n=1 Tax=Hanseniaspora guilliermondii TaxID=56406 RepID=A0A1L0B4K0_9ASCO|nr:related to Damage response protein 1 [Hanseniaspora guilliermondii]
MSFLYNMITGKGNQSEDPTGLTQTQDKQAQHVESTSQSVVLRDYTPKELSNYDGHMDPKIYIAVKGSVFDCTLGRQFYGPSGPYSNFAGRDASRGLAMNSFDDNMIRDIDQDIDDLSDLSVQQMEALDSWFEHFNRKYTYVGKLVPNK